MLQGCHFSFLCESGMEFHLQCQVYLNGCNVANSNIAEYLIKSLWFTFTIMLKKLAILNHFNTMFSDGLNYVWCSMSVRLNPKIVCWSCITKIRIRWSLFDVPKKAKFNFCLFEMVNTLYVFFLKNKGFSCGDLTTKANQNKWGYLHLDVEPYLHNNKKSNVEMEVSKFWFSA